jgi:hypothetical protein
MLCVLFTATKCLDPSAALTSGVLLYPPTAGTAPSLYPAPIIVPTMSNNGGLCGGPTATNPVTSATVAVLSTGSDSEFDVPEFEDDEQMFHYVITKLQRALKDSRVTSEVRTDGSHIVTGTLFVSTTSYIDLCWYVLRAEIE